MYKQKQKVEDSDNSSSDKEIDEEINLNSRIEGQLSIEFQR